VLRVSRVRILGVGDLVVELRGWSREVSEPPYEYLPTVSEVFSPCPTHRDSFLRRVSGVKVNQSAALNVGRVLHEAFLAPFRYVQRGEVGSLVDGLAELKQSLVNNAGDLAGIVKVVYDRASAIALSLVAESQVAPVVVEPPLDGALIGFSDVIKPDLVVGLIPVEVVVTDNWDYLGRKELALAAYALALEAMWGNPVNYGVLVNINPRTGGLTSRVLILTDDLRRAVVRERDTVARIVARGDDPGVAPKCPETCPFYNHCRGGLGDAGSK